MKKEIYDYDNIVSCDTLSDLHVNMHSADFKQLVAS